MSLLDVELRRERWRRYRQGIGLDDPDSATFGLAGLARRARDPRYRLLVLPGDPEANKVQFDDEFWQWWMTDHTPPFDAKLSWGYEKAPSLEAAIRGEKREEQWTQLIAAHRHGGLEVITSPTWERHGTRGFQLIPMVASTWSAMEIQRALAERYSVPGPWEVSLSLRGTEHADLGFLGHGWQVPGGGGWEAPTCFEANVQIVLELDATDWDPEQTAFELAARIEDAWGFNGRRYLANKGDLEGQFDTSQL